MTLRLDEAARIRTIRVPDPLQPTESLVDFVIFGSQERAGAELPSFPQSTIATELDSFHPRKTELRKVIAPGQLCRSSYSPLVLI